VLPEAVLPEAVLPEAVLPAAVRPRAKPLGTARSGNGPFAPALRRLMVTPTFAAGLGVVVAAGLAVTMTTRTVLHFSGPVQQKVCNARGCVNGPGRPSGAGTLASAKPGIRLLPSTGRQSGSAQPGSSSPMEQGSGQYPGGRVAIGYQTTGKWSRGFDGRIVISGLPASLLGSWHLAFDYPGTSIVEVQGAQWQPTGQNSGVAQAETPANGSDSGGYQNEPDGGRGDHQESGRDNERSTVVITIEAAGPASGPANCHFDNAPCTFH
jgi:Cellulose binding domain